MSADGFEIVAAGSIASDGTIASGKGFAAATTGVGVYTITLDAQRVVAAAECVVIATARIATDTRVSVTQTSASVKTVQTFTGAVGTAANSGFDFIVVRVGPGYGP